jgi:hypothetical protein
MGWLKTMAQWQKATAQWLQTTEKWFEENCAIVKTTF